MRASKGKIKRINKDDLRAMIDGGQWSRKNEKIIVQTRDDLCHLYLADEFDVIVDDTNVQPVHERRLREVAKQNNAEFVVKSFLDVPIEVCIQRDLARSRSVGEKVILGMYNQFVLPEIQETYEPFLGLPLAFLFDIDGTLANLGDRSPYDGAKCHLDTPNTPVVAVAQALSREYRIVVMSGRHDTHRALTETWLKEHNVVFDALFMRAEGDNRKDSIIKRELFEEHIRPHYNVVGVFDDRPQVIRMWKEIGLHVFDVGPHYEF